MKIRLNSTRGVVLTNRLGEDNYVGYRSFDFEEYHSAGKYMGWGPIITINDDRADPGFITGYHEHRGLDILSYVVKGQVHHRDNLGNELQAQEGQVQWMSCGTGIWHTEGNTSDKPNRYLQIWIMPNKIAHTWAPKYILITRPTGFAKLPLELQNTQLEVWAGNLDCKMGIANSYLLVLEGSIQVGDTVLTEGDSIDTEGDYVMVEPIGTPHLLLFELH
jgi:redox-sensitive bicupin YhaK (pirin superfamily)